MAEGLPQESYALYPENKCKGEVLGTRMLRSDRKDPLDQLKVLSRVTDSITREGKREPPTQKPLTGE